MTSKRVEVKGPQQVTTNFIAPGGKVPEIFRIDTRRCQHCYTGKRHTAEEHRKMIAFYEDVG